MQLDMHSAGRRPMEATHDLQRKVRVIQSLAAVLVIDLSPRPVFDHAGFNTQPGFLYINPDFLVCC